MAEPNSSILAIFFDYSTSSPKRQKLSHEATSSVPSENSISAAGINEDRISKLPDSIVCHILSFLSTKDCVRTSILSRTWRKTWTLVDSLDFDDLTFIRKRGRVSTCLKSFVSFVNRVLILHSHPCLKRFRLKLRKPDKLNLRNGDITCDVRIWISSAITRNVEELDVSNGSQGLIRLPSSLFNRPTLRILKLNNMIELYIPESESVCLSNLKVLTLQNLLCLSDATMAKLLLGCPVLEELTIERHKYDSLQALHVVSSTMKSLKIKYVGSFGAKPRSFKIVVDAPKLKFLEIIDYNTKEYEIIAMNLSSVIDATINVNPSDAKLDKKRAYQMIQLLAQMCKLQSLRLSSYILKALSEASFQNLPRFLNLTRLVVRANEKISLLISYELLKCSPNLKILTFHKNYYETLDCEPIFEVPECFTSSIEMLELRGIKGDSEDLEIIEYFLKNAKLLKTIRIGTCHSPRSEKGWEFLKKLLLFTRCSSHCQIIVC